MKFKKLFEDWDLKELKLKTGWAEATFRANNADKQAAWEMYIEMLTRIVTQPLPEEHGDEKAALNSIYQLFPLTREILKRNTFDCENFALVAIVVLNQIVRPFTAKWHRLSLAGNLDTPKGKKQFRIELADLQIKLTNYARMLAKIADVEDLTQTTENKTI
jgi:hypothetical protein